MASPKKKGLIYYSSDTDRYQDIKIKRLRKALGCVGLAVWDYILNEIYRVEGCFLFFDEDVAFDIADYLGLEEAEIYNVVAFCCKTGLLDSDLYKSEKVLTSRAIQERYVAICKQAKRRNINLPKAYTLLSFSASKIPEETPIPPEETPIPLEETPIPPEETPIPPVFAPKVKKSKVKESKRKEKKRKEKITPNPLKGAIVQEQEQDAAPVDDGNLYRTKKGKVLKGEKLARFEELWEAYGVKRGKAEAADAFLAQYRPDIWAEIVAAARHHAEIRPVMHPDGKGVKFLQGWLSGRRWEDDLTVAPETRTVKDQQELERENMARRLLDEKRNSKRENRGNSCGFLEH